MIKITDRFYINATTHCYILQEKMIVQDPESKNYGKEVFKELGYYTTIDNLLKGFAKVTTREFISQKEKGDIEDLIKEIHRINGYIENLNLKGV